MTISTMESSIERSHKGDRSVVPKLDNSAFVKTNLPSGIVEDILSRVPVKPLVRFRCVSKQWRNLLTTDPIFLQNYLIRAAKDDESHGLIFYLGSLNEFYFVADRDFKKVEKLDSSYIKTCDVSLVVGSSNGLICLSHENIMYPNRSVLSIWNPFTKDYKILPDPQIRSPKSGVEIVALGFCFHPIINQHKVVRFVHLEDPRRPSFGTHIEIYSLTTDSWRRLGVFPYYISGYSSRAILNGLVHWPASRRTSYVNSQFELILSFDMADEVLLEVPMPDDLNPKEIQSLYLRTHRDCLSMFVIVGEELNFWVMKEYNSKESWTKLITVEYQQTTIPYPFEFLKNGELLLEMYDKTLRSYITVLYNLESKKFKELDIVGVTKRVNVDAIPYVKSLVPLGGAGNQVKGQENGVVHSGEEGYGESIISNVVDEGELYAFLVDEDELYSSVFDEDWNSFEEIKAEERD